MGKTHSATGREKFLEKFLGKRNENTQESRINKELSEPDKEPDVAFVRRQRLRWLGHIQKMIWNRTLKGLPREGLGRKSNKNFKVCGIANGKDKAINKTEWRKCIPRPEC